MQIAYRARDLAEAHIVAGLLQSRGIECHVGGHYLQGAMGEIGAAGFTNVHVEDEDYVLARTLVSEYESANAPESASAHGEDRANRYATWFLLFLAVVMVVLFGAL
ncbi:MULTISPECIES: DUF2007 domain-containing protein [Marinobacter]|jgi:putative signal transducing protein|uniref:DUF2007 domain-containing protein n=1 Tax=Marinobacter algicola DG893 TaxID=443152 RepID=A6EV66_9GAMM|nr:MULTISPECIES: DUF2007 domain-containing protein [Marinobacter]EDM49715.1 hypothetical protein MDG893_10956 [Marinobacter algicola DG893]MBP55579.1 DUF2007 domain-containing protein [Marinobacter sp.]